MSEPISNEVIIEDAVRQLEALLPGSPYTKYGNDEATEIIRSAITKACAERDEELNLLRAIPLGVHEQKLANQNNRLSSQLAVMKEALEKIVVKVHGMGAGTWTPILCELKNIAEDSLSSLPAAATKDSGENT